MNITAFGRTYTSRNEVEQRIATLEAGNAQYGASDDRVTEINALRDALPTETVYEVERGDYEMPCGHPMCALLHKRFHTGSEMSDEWVDLPNGDRRLVRVRGIHEKIVRQWIILRDGERVGEAYDTKRDALAAAANRPTY